MAKTQAAQAAQASQGPSAQDRSQARFLNLLKGDVLKLDLAELDFGIYRILNYRRTQVLAYLNEALPGRITAWTDALAKSSGRELASTEAENCYTQAHANFPVQILPDGSPQPGYRVEAMLAQDVVKTAIAALRKNMSGAQVSPSGWERMVSVIREEGGEIDLKDTLANVLLMLDNGSDADTLGPPLPRLHVPQHLYAPLLLAAPAAPVQTDGQLSLLDDQPVTLKISPPPLKNSEARLVWDVRRRWEQLHSLPHWEGVEVVLLRNLAGVGVGLFAAEGFFPDFLLWLKRGKHQALAFVEPKGLRHQWPEDKFRLLEDVVPKWNFSVPICGYVLSANTETELKKIQPGFSWTSAPKVLLHQDAQGDYVETLLGNVLALLKQP